MIDLWFRFFRQLNGFRVAPPFEVKYAIIIPSVLIITNQLALRIGGQRGFSGARQTKEDGHIAFFPYVS
ncbi:hypothetical protein D3C87_2163240 [compost metagenome]